MEVSWNIKEAKQRDDNLMLCVRRESVFQRTIRLTFIVHEVYTDIKWTHLIKSVEALYIIFAATSLTNQTDPVCQSKTQKPLFQTNCVGRNAQNCSWLHVLISTWFHLQCLKLNATCFAVWVKYFFLYMRFNFVFSMNSFLYPPQSDGRPCFQCASGFCCGKRCTKGSQPKTFQCLLNSCY